MDIDMDEIVELMKVMTLDQWKDFSGKVIRLHEREISMITRFLRQAEGKPNADKETLDIYRSILQKDIEAIQTIENITKDLEYAEEKIRSKTTKTSEASQADRPEESGSPEALAGGTEANEAQTLEFRDREGVEYKGDRGGQD
jgi:hypothetical protein